MLTVVLEFRDLHLTEKFSAAKKALAGLSGVYAITCTITGAIYIGSSVEIANRLYDHLVERNTNEHLQRAIALYGLDCFMFTVVEVYVVDPQLSAEENQANLLAREQHWLNWLFSLPENLRYNFASIVGAPIAGRQHTDETRTKISNSLNGRTHTDETRAKMRATRKGKTHTAETRAKISAAVTGINHPMFGKVAARAITVYVYSLDKVLVNTFDSQVAAAKWLGTSNITVINYIRSGKVFQGKYILTTFLKE